MAAVRRNAGWGLLAVLASALLADAAHAEIVFPNAGSIGMEPPAGMTLSSRFAGFEDSAQTASILIAELPAEAYAQLESGFTPEALRSKGIEVIQRREWPVAGAQAFLIRGTQAAQGQTFDKWMLVVGAPDTTAIITVQVPAAADDAYSDAAIEASLRSVALKSAGTLEEQLATLPFRVTDPAGFRIVRTLAGSGVLMTEGPKDEVPDFSQPVIVIAGGLDTAPAPEAQDDFARHGLATLPYLQDIRIEHAEGYERDGVRWHRIEAMATDADSGIALSVLQLIRFLPDGWIRVGAITAEDQGAALRERVLRLAEAVEPRL